MRNRYPGTCYFCQKTVEPKAGHFERRAGRWAVIHATCVFAQREAKVDFLPNTSLEPSDRQVTARASEQDQSFFEPRSRVVRFPQPL